MAALNGVDLNLPIALALYDELSVSRAPRMLGKTPAGQHGAGQIADDALLQMAVHANFERFAERKKVTQHRAADAAWLRRQVTQSFNGEADEWNAD